MIPTQTTAKPLPQPPIVSNSKKRFGKNLSKLIKQPAPPIATVGSASGSSRASSTSTRNGLLLLSTKKIFSNNGVKAFAKLNQGTEIEHSNSIDDKSKEPPQLAWGLDKKLVQNRIPSDPKSAPYRSLSSSHENITSGVDKALNNAKLLDGLPKESPDEHGENWIEISPRLRNDHLEPLSNNIDLEMITLKVEKKSSFNKEECLKADRKEPETLKQETEDHVESAHAEAKYKPKTSTIGIDERNYGEGQVQYMARLAKERAEKRRQEEEARMNEQKERAARRLEELEKKIGNNPPFTVVPSFVEKDRFNDKSNFKRTPALEHLGNTKKGDSKLGAEVVEENTENMSTHKTLFDPNFTYSSMVGGSKIKVANGEVTKKDSVTDEKNFRKEKNQHPPKPLIHINSYEDSNRGSRNSSSGPRMLFDPKSGSMVAAPSRDEINITGKVRKERTKQKMRSNKDRDESEVATNLKSFENTNGKSLIRHRSLSDDLERMADDYNEGKLTRYRSIRRNDNTSSRKDKKTNEKVLENSRPTRSDSGSRAKSQHLNSHNNEPGPGGNLLQMKYEKNSRLPRTCGVLYKRDSKGNLFSADDCEGDQGHGAHSVPGGKVKNPNAYAVFIQHRMRSDSKAQEFKGGRFMEEIGGMMFFVNSSQQNFAKTSASANRLESFNTPFKVDYDERENGVLGLTRSNFMNSSQRKKLDDESEKSYLNIPSQLRVKPNEKIELLTGEDESPTLQATAAAWAPSEAAIAAAKAATSRPPISDSQGLESASLESNEISESDVPAIDAMALFDNDDLDEHEISTFGLGFDPTKNMDSVIKSPINKKTEKIGIEIPNLCLNQTCESLTPDLKANSFVALGNSGHLLGSSTWGIGGSNSVSMNGVSNWDYSGKLNASKGDSVAKPRNGSNTLSASSFLSLGTIGSHENTWGSGGFATGFCGLGETPLAKLNPNESSRDAD
mmetsp:Transcript_1290/g.1854  ORF Transcript_1290/g.1854 Transcript_1290/m.1854 type:complete len:955 (-) Transcript_1290:509-3373(-)